MRFDAETGDQQGSGLGLHRAAAVGIRGELAGGDIMLDDGVVEQGFEQRGTFNVRNAPGDDPAAKKNIDDDIPWSSSYCGRRVTRMWRGRWPKLDRAHRG
jgi:hypothetical protein